LHTAFLREIESETGCMLESVEHHRNWIELVANDAEELLDLKRSVIEGMISLPHCFVEESNRWTWLESVEVERKS
jgi:hypothetical protein